MEFLRLALLFLHVLGFAALLGGLVVQARDTDKRVNPAMRDGIGTACDEPEKTPPPPKPKPPQCSRLPPR